jgi:hypothetical protein
MLHDCQRVHPLVTLIVNHEAQSNWVHVDLDLLFFLHSLDDVTQIFKLYLYPIIALPSITPI